MVRHSWCPVFPQAEGGHCFAPPHLYWTVFSGLALLLTCLHFTKSTVFSMLACSLTYLSFPIFWNSHFLLTLLYLFFTSPVFIFKRSCQITLPLLHLMHFVFQIYFQHTQSLLQPGFTLSALQITYLYSHTSHVFVTNQILNTTIGERGEVAVNSEKVPNWL